MRIGIDARMYGSAVTGIGIYVKELTQTLFEIDKKNDYVVFLLPDAFKNFCSPRFGVSAVCVDTPWYGWREQVILPWIFARQHCDVVHFPNFNVPVLYPKKFVVTIHDLTPLEFPGPNQARFGLRRLAYRTVLRYGMRRAARIIAVSKLTADQIAALEPRVKNKIEIVYPGLSPSFRKPLDCGIIEHQFKKHGIRKPYLFYTGVWSDHKNIPGLIAAWSYIREQYDPAVQLVLGGNPGRDFKRLAPLISKYPKGSIIVTGFIPDQDLPGYYQRAAVTVIPSFREGFGLVGIESLACGTPVAASVTTSLPEVLGPAGRYFPPDDPEKMAKVIIELIQADHRDAVLRLAPGVVEKYRWDRAAQKMQAIYESIV